MASGYITSDGKDLDQRYLGIDAKAKSAEVADTVKQITTLSGLKPMAVLAQAPINVDVFGYSTPLSWTAPSHGLFIGTLRRAGRMGKSQISLRDQIVWGPSTGEFDVGVTWALNAGDKIETTAADGFEHGIRGTFYPWAFL